MTAITSDSYNAMRSATKQWQRIGATGNRVFPVGGLNDWQVKAIKKLASFSALEQGWDSYGSPSISDDVLDIATDIVAKATVDYVSPPRIIPVSGGGVQIEWSRESREIEVEVHPDLSIEVLLSENGQPQEDLELPGVDPAFVGILLSWLEVR